MTVEKTDRKVGVLVDQVSAGEIRLPEIQRSYVWKPTQVARLVESLYRGYPSGSLLLWSTAEAPVTRPVAVHPPTVTPVTASLYLLDGQQRLTSLHRVFTDRGECSRRFSDELRAVRVSTQRATNARSSAVGRRTRGEPDADRRQ